MKTFFGAIILLICLPFLAVGIYESGEAYAQLQTFSRAVGIVRGNSYLTTTSDVVVSGAYHPNIEFIDQTGEKNSFTDGIGSLPADYETGESVEVIYDSQNPLNARIYSWKRFRLAPFIFIAVGIVPALIAFLIMRKLDF